MGAVNLSYTRKGKGENELRIYSINCWDWIIIIIIIEYTRGKSSCILFLDKYAPARDIRGRHEQFLPHTSLHLNNILHLKQRKRRIAHDPSLAKKALA